MPPILKPISEALRYRSFETSISGITFSILVSISDTISGTPISGFKLESISDTISDVPISAAYRS
jgi:hypothetical protein